MNIYIYICFIIIEPIEKVHPCERLEFQVWYEKVVKSAHTSELVLEIDLIDIQLNWNAFLGRLGSYAILGDWVRVSSRPGT